jgi:hypothetical protein
MKRRDSIENSWFGGKGGGGVVVWWEGGASTCYMPLRRGAGGRIRRPGPGLL